MKTEILSKQPRPPLSVIRQTREQQLTQVQAGTVLRLTHRGRGTPSNRRIPAKVKATALRLYAQR